MTRNRSPVYLMYPPDRSGRRANDAVQLQHASTSEGPTAYERNRATRPLEATPRYSTHSPQPGPFVYPRQTSPATSNTSQGWSAQPNVRERPSIRMPGDYTSSESSSGENQRQHTPRTRTVLWYCCHGPGRGHGPHNVQIHNSCITCDHRICAYCQQEAIFVRDRAVSQR